MVVFLATLALAACPAVAKKGPPNFIQFSVQDLEENFIPIGEVEFCNSQGVCIYADIDRGFPGHFYVKSADLDPDSTYTVMIYNMDVQVTYEMRDWVYYPDDYDPGWDSLLKVDKFLVFPQFHGHDDGFMEFKITNTLNPEWEEKAGKAFAVADPLDLPDVPPWIWGVQFPFMLGGKFSSDENAAGGVIEVHPGWGLSASWRHGYPPELPPGGKWVSFREVGLTYLQNRYDTNEVMEPGEVSDVTFHRVRLSYGFGRMSQSMSTHWTVWGGVAVGGIYDGKEVVEYLGRTYSLFGIGAGAKFLRVFYSAGGLDLGFLAEASAMFYPANAGDDDFWYGLAPSISIGVAVF